jgi:hypothetical protein
VAIDADAVVVVDGTAADAVVFISFLRLQGCSSLIVLVNLAVAVRRLLNIVADSTSSTLSTIGIRRLIKKIQDY